MGLSTAVPRWLEIAVATAFVNAVLAVLFWSVRRAATAYIGDEVEDALEEHRRLARLEEEARRRRRERERERDTGGEGGDEDGV